MTPRPRLPRAVAVGYASMDRAMATGPFQGDQGTTLVRARLSDPWPSPGGVAYLARALAAAGVPAEAVSWVGADADGAAFTGALRGEGIGVSGVAIRGTRSPTSHLFYPEGGGTVCVFDPGDCHEVPLDRRQRSVVATADWLLVAVGPRVGIDAALAAARPDARVAWTVKPDAEAFPPELIRRLVQRASAITYGAAERPFVENAVGDLTAHCPRGTLLVETRGGDGAAFRIDGTSGEVPGRRITGVDTTGAGDTLVATLVAALGGPPTTDTAGPAVRAAVEAASALLRSRTGN